MREGTRNFMVGLISLIALIGLVLLLFLFGEIEHLVQPRYTVILQMNDAGGLRRGGIVELNGVRIGIVGDIRLVDGVDRPVQAVLQINNDRRIPQDVRPIVNQSVFGGQSSLQLVHMQPDVDTPMLPTDGSAIIQGTHVSVLDRLLTSLDVRLAPLQNAMGNIERLTDTYVILGENLNDLVHADDSQHVDARSIMRRLDSTLVESSAAVSDLRAWLNDGDLQSDVRDLVSRASQAMDDTSSAAKSIEQLSERFDSRAESLMARLLPAVDQAAVSLEEITRLTRAARTGKGSIAQLINNPDLYNSLNDAAIRMQRMLDEANLLLREIREEGLEIGL